MPPEVPITWLTEQRVDGRLVARVGRRQGEFVAELANVGLLTTATDGQAMRFDPVQGVDPVLLEKLNVSLVAALARHARGEFTLHASAASLDGRAVAIVGESGSGKSTIVAALCQQGDLQLVADDTVALEFTSIPGSTVRVLPTQKSAWLLPDARTAIGLPGNTTGKCRVDLCVAEVPSVPLHAIVGLRFDATTRRPLTRRLRGHEAFRLLSKAVIRMVVDDPTVQAKEFDRLRELVEFVPVFELQRVRDLAQINATAACLRQLMHDSSEGSADR